MSDSELTAAAVGAALASGLILIIIAEIGMRQRPKPPAIFRTIELFLLLFMFAAISFASYLGTLHKPYVPTWANAILLALTVILGLPAAAIAIFASTFTITKTPHN